MHVDVTTYSDPEWVDNKETRTCSSAAVVLVGTNMLESHKRKQCAASESKGIAPIMCHPVFLVKTLLVIDAKATDHVLHRQGMARMKHIDVACRAWAIEVLFAVHPA